MRIRAFSFVLLFVLLSLTSFTHTSLASEKISLKSTNTSVKEFEKIYAEKFIDDKGEEGYKVTIEDEVEKNGTDGYSVSVDIEKGTYHIEQLSENEFLQEYQKEAIGTEVEIGETDLLFIV